jgi:hypothetical protein
VTVSAGEATPGYLTGALVPGNWNVMINCVLINPGASISYTLDIAIGFEPQGTAPTPTRGVTPARGPGWYRGDLHGHTFHSDGQWDAAGLLNFARQNHLDFITLTDHNTVSGLPEMDSLSSPDLLTMGGFELTTFYGHALALGLRHTIDWRMRPGARSMADMYAEVEAAGGLFVIAHPAVAGDPYCTGCHWEYLDMMPGPARLVEVCNEWYTSNSNNEGALELWYRWLNEGRRIFATVGTDIHGPIEPAPEFMFNVVYAKEFSESAILDGVRHGHAYLSSGPRLDVAAQSSGEQAIMGDSLAGKRAEFSARWSDCRSGDRVRIIVDGHAQDEFATDSDGQHSWTLDDGQPHWCLIEIRDANGVPRAISNPIFTGQTG